MTTIIGHHDVLTVLERELPPVALLAGPPSVGKWTMAWHLADHHQVARIDRFSHREPLTIDLVRTIVKWAHVAAMQSAFKLVIVELDAASLPALHALLKILEEPPPSCRFILTASAPTLPTIVSRAETFRIGLLVDEELVDVLVAQGVAPGLARKLAPLGRGRVDHAHQAEKLLPARAAALSIVKALGTGDRELFEQACTNVDEDAGRLLRTWLHEAITGQWRWFTPTDLYGIGPARLRQMLVALSQFSAARPRIGVRAALAQFLPD